MMFRIHSAQARKRPSWEVNSTGIRGLPGEGSLTALGVATGGLCQMEAVKVPTVDQ